MVLRKITSEEKSELVVRLKEHFSKPEAQEELRQAGEKVQRGLGLTGNPQYDDFVKRAEHSKWWNSIKDKPLIARQGYQTQPPY